MGTSKTPVGSRAIRDVLEEIAAAAGLDLSVVGNSRTIHNEPCALLRITIKAPHVVEAGHFGEDDETGKPMADPAVTYYIGLPQAGWIPCSYRNDYVGEHMVAATVENGQVVVTDPGTLRTLIKFSNSWGERLTYQRYVKAAKEQGSRAAWTL